MRTKSIIVKGLDVSGVDKIYLYFRQYDDDRYKKRRTIMSKISVGDKRIFVNETINGDIALDLGGNRYENIK